MDPNNFLKYAKAIENAAPQFLIDEETDCRTGIGRAQYSVFLEFREEIGKKIQTIDSTLASKYQNLITGKIPKRGRIHGIIPKIIGEYNPTLRNQYHTLRQHRNTADYDMAKTISMKDLKAANQLASRIKNRIGIIHQARLQKSQIVAIFNRQKI